MKKKLIAGLLALCMLATTACGGGEPAVLEQPKTDEPSVSQTQTADTTEDSDETEAVSDESDQTGDMDAEVESLVMSVNRSDGKLSINRAQSKNTPMGSEDTWTIFVYLCGTNLESTEDSAPAATYDIIEMAQYASRDGIRYVVQTGGTNMWQNEIVDASKTQRFLIENEDIEMVYEDELTSMGDPETLLDFLQWGIDEYPAEKMGLILWDHGSGSINGVCFDEVFDDDSLSLSEINTVLSKVYKDMTDKFEFIGFDACLMGTAEAANILSTYARYMYGSQEIEPGCGWNYEKIGEFLSENPSANGAELGQVMADGFLQGCIDIGSGDGATMAVIDLEKYDDFLKVFNDYAEDMYETLLAGDYMNAIIRNINDAENFGGNNKSEGYTNMVDLRGILTNCSDYVDASEALAALDDCVIYKTSGSDHRNAGGLSIYYPLSLQGSSELKIFSDVCISPYYLSIVDMMARGYTDDLYSNDALFDEDGNWINDVSDTTDLSDSDYFEYADEEVGDSQLINLAYEPFYDDDGCYTAIVDEDSLDYLADVCAVIYYSPDGELLLELGYCYDLSVDWDNGIVQDAFDGRWLSLPDGQMLPMYIVEADSEHIVYTSPILLNGNRTNLRIRNDGDGVYVEGAWDGIDENGSSAREIKKIKDGDEITPLYYVYDEENGMIEVDMDPYEWEDGDYVDYTYLPEGIYTYAFEFTDIFGDTMDTEPAAFIIDEEGTITFNPDDDE